MSSILKALKRAEQLRSADARDTCSEKLVYQDAKHAGGRPFIIVICSAILAVSGFYLVYARLSFRDVMVTNNAADRAPAAPQPATQAVPPQIETIEGRQLPRVASGDATVPAEDMNRAAIREIKVRQYAKAEQLLKRALSLQQDNAELYNNLGMALKFQSRHTEAITSYEKALSLKPDYPEALNNLAVVRELSGSRQKALELYNRAVALRPSYAEAHLNLGLLLEAMGNLSEAEDHLLLFLNLSTDPALKQRVRSKLRTLQK